MFQVIHMLNFIPNKTITNICQNLWLCLDKNKLMLVFFYLTMLILQIYCEIENWNNREVVNGRKQLVSEVSPTENIIFTALNQVIRNPKKIKVETVPHIYLQEDSEFPLEKSAEILLDNRDAEICGQNKGIKQSPPEIIYNDKFILNGVKTYKNIKSNKKTLMDGYEQNTDIKVDQMPKHVRKWKRSNKSCKVKFKELQNKTREKRKLFKKNSSSYRFGPKNSTNQSSKKVYRKRNIFTHEQNYFSSLSDWEKYKVSTQATSLKSVIDLKHRNSAKREIGDLFSGNRQDDNSTPITSNENVNNLIPSSKDEVSYRENASGEIKLFCEANVDKKPNKIFTELSSTFSKNTTAESYKNNFVSSNTSSIPSGIHTVKREFVGVKENNCNSTEVNKNHTMIQHIMGQSTVCDRDRYVNNIRQYGVTEKLVKKGTTEDVCINIFHELTEKKTPTDETDNDEGVYTSNKSLCDSKLSTIFTEITNGIYKANKDQFTSEYQYNFFDSNANLKVTTGSYVLDNFHSSASQRVKVVPLTNTTKPFETRKSSTNKNLDFSRIVTEPELVNSENVKQCLSLFQKINLISTTPSFDDTKIKTPYYFKPKEDEMKMAKIHQANGGFAASCNLPRSERPKFTFFPDEQNAKVTSDSIYYDFHINKSNRGPKHTLSFVSGASSSKTSNKKFDTFMLKLVNQSHVFQKAKANTKSPLLILNHDEFKKTGSTLPLLKRILGLTSKKPTKILPSATLSVEECITLKVHPVRHKGGDPGNHYHHGQLEPTICEVKKKQSDLTCLQLTPELESSKSVKTLTTCPPHSKSCDECEVNDLKDILPQKTVSSTKNLLNHPKNIPLFL